MKTKTLLSGLIVVLAATTTVSARYEPAPTEPATCHQRTEACYAQSTQRGVVIAAAPKKPSSKALAACAHLTRGSKAWVNCIIMNG